MSTPERPKERCRMLIRKAQELSQGEVTPKSVYLSRRQILRAMGIAGVTLAGGKVLSDILSPSASVDAGSKLDVTVRSPFSTTEKINKYEDVTHYNNFYEFGT